MSPPEPWGSRVKSQTSLLVEWNVRRAGQGAVFGYKFRGIVQCTTEANVGLWEGELRSVRSGICERVLRVIAVRGGYSGKREAT